MQTKLDSPKVSIGLPVHNGQEYIEKTIESLLNQTFQDFELIVCDNKSTDQTPDIVSRLSRRDGRIRYFQNANNIGAAQNFNKTFQLATGEYFKWAAHDDICQPELLARCVQILDDNPSAVLAHTGVQIIGPSGDALDSYDPNLCTDADDVSERYGALLDGHKCLEIFGLIRSAVLRKTKLIGSYANGDGVLLAHLSLFGKFVQDPEALFMPRSHPSQSMAMLGDYRHYTEWFDPKRKAEWAFPYWEISLALLSVVLRAPLSTGDRYRCIREWMPYVYPRRRLLWGDITFQIRRLAALAGVKLSRRRFSQDDAIALVTQTLQEGRDRPLEIRYSEGGQGNHEVLIVSFITPEVGVRYQPKLERLTLATGWRIVIDTLPVLEEIKRTASDVFQLEGDRVEVDTTMKLVRLHSIDPSEAEISEFLAKTGYHCEVLRYSE